MLKVLPTKNDVKFFETDKETSEMISSVYNWIQEDRNLKFSTFNLFNDRTIQELQDDSIRDYLIYTPAPNINDWMREYRSGIVRDACNVFISNLATKQIVPDITAQNKNQDIDKLVAKVGRQLLEFVIDNDGRPAESGHSKYVRKVTKQIIEGTVHTLHYIDDNKMPKTEIIPNEEVFVPNLWEFNEQKQSHFLRIQNKTFWEGKNEFRQFPNFDSAINSLDKSFKAGKIPRIVYIYREPVDAFIGTIKRMIRNPKEKGRVVPVSITAKNHPDSLNVVKKIFEEYKDLVSNGKLRFTLIDNARGAGNAEKITYQQVKNIRIPEDIEKQMRLALEKINKDGIMINGKVHHLSPEQYNKLSE